MILSVAALNEAALTVSRERRGYAQKFAPAGLAIPVAGRTHERAGRSKRGASALPER